MKPRHGLLTNGLLAIGLLLCASLALGAASADLHKIAPPDALLFVWVKDSTQLRDNWAKTPPARFWNDPAVKQFTVPLRGELTKLWDELKEQSKVVREGWFTYLPGEIVFYSEAMIDHGEYFEMPLCFAARTALPRERYQEWIDKYIATLPPDANKRSYEVSGITVRAVEYREPMPAPETESEEEKPAAGPAAAAAKSVPAYFQYAFGENVLLWTDGDEKVMRGMISRLQKPPKQSVLDNPACARVLAHLSNNSEIFGYAALGQYFGHIAQQIKKRGAGLIVPLNFEAFGLDKLGGVAAGVQLGQQQVKLSVALTFPETGPGVVSLLRRLHPSPMASLALTPDSAIDYGSSALDWAGMYSDLRTMIRAGVPPLDLAMSMALTTFENSTKLKIDGILGALGEEMGSFVVAPAGKPHEPQQVLLFAVKDARRLEEAGEAIAVWLQDKARIEKTEFLGYTIRALRPQLPGDAGPAESEDEELPSLSWVVTDNFLIVSGSSDLIKHVLQLKAGKRTDSLAKSPHYTRARALLPNKVDSIEVIRVGAWGEMLLSALTGKGEMSVFAELLGELFDLKAPVPPSTFARYFDLCVSGGFFEPSGLSVLVLLAGSQP